MQTWRIRIHSSLQSEIFKVSLWWPFKKMLRNWKQKTDTSQTLKMMTAWQFIKLYHKRIITAMNVYLPFLSCINNFFIQNKTGQRKQTQLVMVIRDSHLQFDKTKISIEADLRKFICNPDKPHICWSNHNTEHKWPKKADAATVTRPYFPTTVWQDQNQHSDRIAWAYFQSRQDALMLILA